MDHIENLLRGLFLIEGGSVLQCLQRQEFDYLNQDVDFFFINGNHEQFCQTIEDFHTNLKDKIIDYRTNYKVVHFVLSLQTRGHLRIQFVFTRSEATASQVLNEFDLDLVQLAFTGAKLIGTLAFFQAARTKSFICYKTSNDIRDVPYYLDRCFKYMSHGFQWLVPTTYDENLSQMPMVFKKYHFDYAFRDFFKNVDVFGTL